MSRWMRGGDDKQWQWQEVKGERERDGEVREKET